jgi:hypothetical protein
MGSIVVDVNTEKMGMVLLVCSLINPARVTLFLFWYDSLMHFYLLTCIATRHAPIVGVCKERHVPKPKNISVYIFLHEVMIFRFVWISPILWANKFWPRLTTKCPADSRIWDSGARRLTVFSVMFSIQFSSRILSSFSKFKATIFFGVLSVASLLYGNKTDL